MFYRIFFLIILTFSLHGKSVTAQLLDTRFTPPGREINAVLQPILKPNAHYLNFLGGFGYAIAGRRNKYTVELFSTEQARLSGISYSPKANHVYFNKVFSRPILINNGSLLKRADLTISNAQFWNRASSRMDLNLSRLELKASVADFKIGIISEFQSERLESPFSYETVTVPTGTYSNWTSAVQLEREITKFLAIQGEILVGESYNHKRFTQRIKHIVNFLPNAKAILDVEYNRIHGEGDPGWFYLILTTEFKITKDVTLNWIELRDERNHLTAGIAGISYERPRYKIKFQYREIRDEKYKIIVSDGPLFSSNFLLQLTILLHPRNTYSEF